MNEEAPYRIVSGGGYVAVYRTQGISQEWVRGTLLGPFPEEQHDLVINAVWSTLIAVSIRARLVKLTPANFTRLRALYVYDEDPVPYLLPFAELQPKTLLLREIEIKEQEIAELRKQVDGHA